MISIITPTYNSGEFLEKCICSIMSQGVDVEHIIVDGGSKDNTIEIIKKYESAYHMRWISEKDDGMYDAINKGMKMAKGDIVAWLNADDQYMPWTLKVVNHVFEMRPDVRWITGIPMRKYSEDTVSMTFNSKKVYPQWIIRGKGLRGGYYGTLQQESTFWRKDLWDDVGGVDAKYKLAGDFHLWCSFAKYTKLYTVNSPLACFTIRAGQKSGDRVAYNKEQGKPALLCALIKKLKLFRLVGMCSCILHKDQLIRIEELDR